MKIVQSFWTGNNQNMQEAYGWISNKYHYLGWILSVNQLSLFYKDVELFTDKYGYSILIEKLNLPYTKVHIVLDELNNYNKDLWALAKIKTYSLMQEPFLHIDGDVFIWEKFDNNLLSQNLIVQNIETTTNYYRDMWKGIYPCLAYLPYSMSFYHEGLSNKAYNMGIFGGNDLEFIKKYTLESFDFVNKNVTYLDKINSFNFNIFFEQVLLFEMARLHKKEVSVLIHNDIGDNDYIGFGNFDETPIMRTYLHLLGFFKKQLDICLKLETYVQKYYPQYYNKLEDLLLITPKLSHFGYRYSLTDNHELAIKYQQKLLNNYKYENDNEEILSRNIFMEGKVMEFVSLLENNEIFYIIPTSYFKHNIDSNCLEIRQLNEEFFIIPLLNIDEVIFSELDGTLNNIEFEEKALQYLDDDFPVEEYRNYISTLWKRIEYFISHGVLFPLKEDIE